MLAGALGTYAAALIVVGASLALGAGVLAASGAREWSWSAPAIGLAAATMIAWWTVRLPGHGWTALGAVVLAALVAGSFAAPRLQGSRAALMRAAPTFAVALAAVSIPFLVEGHFGILGSGFNVDMSQHLFAADWLADPSGSAPSLFEQGYPLGPHALAVGTGEISGELATSFSGVTIAVPVIAALTALAALGTLPRWRATIVAALSALAYLPASYLAQGSFKELFEVVFLLGFALWLAALPAPRAGRGRLLVGLPGAVLAAGALYAYSGPGLAWLLGTAAIWGAIELARRRPDSGGALRRSLPIAAAALLALAVLAAPEFDRIVDFGGSVGTVSDASGSEASGRILLADRDTAAGLADRVGEGPRFDNDLGNLFGEINPLEAFGVWPSGDFRVEPGDGAVPALAFYAGAALGIAALGLGVAAAARRGESALLAALAAAAAIWLGARLASTPYTTAKALQMVAPVAMLLAARAALAPPVLPSLRERIAWPGVALAQLGLAFLAAAAASSGLALINAPVGPEDYSAGVGELSEHFAGAPTLLFAPADVLSDQHGVEFYGWELREADPACVAAEPERPGRGRAPGSIDFVLSVDGEQEPPFGALERIASRDGVSLWEPVRSPPRVSVALPPEVGTRTDCRVALR